MAGGQVWAQKDIRESRAALCRLIEPGDLLGTVTIRSLGVQQAEHLIRSGQRATHAQQQTVGEAAEAAGLGPRQRNLADALDRWRTRLSQLGGPMMLDALYRRGGGVIVPEDQVWPEPLHDLGAAEPIAVWFRVAAQDKEPYEEAALRLPRPGRSIALVGSREMTDYGGRAAWETASELAAHGVCVVSGGAYGVDAAAHRGALASGQEAEASTLAILAGGVDRLYPAGNERLLKQVMEAGMILSEMAPGSAPTRHRFLQRNRIIAALSAATVVVEARARSGALATAHHALEIGRPVGAVPGSIYSASSTGCHQLLRQTPAQLVTDAAEVMQLVADEVADTVRQEIDHPMLPGPAQAENPRLEVDGLSDLERRIYDALPVRRFTPVGKLSEVAGLPVPQVLSGLTRLHRRHLARADGGSWARASTKA
ncbi:DNA-processing protein DprA [Nesterenkonia muleiensis]|uniref:DNA-processing protein DprA n=1 Tax=Nesterenkonia muleiensis TaxID=2282648 RepID=UPI000E75CAB2|nr:DNA-processing protein DprA [Nesterenkonia muleiensis]